MEVVVVTGAGSGLGACVARRFSQGGARVILLGRTREWLERTAESLSGESAVYPLDVSRKAQVEETFARIYQDEGTIHRLVNCAGVGIFDLAENLGQDAVDAMIDTNLKGTIYPTQAVLPRMKRDNSGCIINVISLSGVRANPTESVYCASKFGVEGFSKAVTLETAGTGIRISNFYMGNMATELWKGDRAKEMPEFIRPGDVADLIYLTTAPRSHMLVEEVRIRNFRG